MDIRVERNNEVVFTFLKDTKEGKYAEVDSNVIEIPRITTTRNEYIFDKDMPMFYSINNHI